MTFSKKITTLFFLFLLSLLTACGGGSSKNNDTSGSIKPDSLFIMMEEGQKITLSKQNIIKGDLVEKGLFVKTHYSKNDDFILSSPKIDAPVWDTVKLVRNETGQVQILYVQIKNTSGKDFEEKLKTFYNQSGKLIDLKETYSIYRMYALNALNSDAISLNKYNEIKNFFSKKNLVDYNNIQYKIDEFTRKYNQYKMGWFFENELKNEFDMLKKEIEEYALINSSLMFDNLRNNGIIENNYFLRAEKLFYVSGDYSYYRGNPKYGQFENNEFSFFDNYGYMKWLQE